MAFISWYRDDVEDVQDFALLSDDPETAGDEIRTFLDDNEASILATDTIWMVGEADFGALYSINLPPAIYRGATAAEIAEGYDPARWLTQTPVDTRPTKAGDQCGICFTSYVRFENFYLGGVCAEIYEDGGLLSFWKDYTGVGVAEFYNCEIDASGGMDWGIYSTWTNENGDRRFVLVDCLLKFCRFGVVMGGYGDGWMSIEMTRVTGIGDANGSRSQGTSSGRGLATYDAGSVLTLAYNRGSSSTSGPGHYIRMVDCSSTCTGLTAFYDGGVWGCPRIAALATNAYDYGLQNAADHPTNPLENGAYNTGNTSYFIGCTYSIVDPGVSEEVYDIDLRTRSGVPIIRYSPLPTPPEYPNAVVWQPTPSEFCWLGSVGSSAHPTASGDVIANAETLISSRVLVPNAANKGPKWRGNGWMWYGTDGADNRNLTYGTVGSTSSLLNNFHVDGTGHILVRVKLDAANDGGFKMICCNCRLTNTHKGFGLRISDSGVSMAVWAGGVAAILAITHAGPFVTGREHVIEAIVRPSPALSSINVDGGTPVTGTIGTLTTGDSNEQFTIGARSNLSVDNFNGQIRDLIVASSELSSTYVSDWYRRQLSPSGDKRIRLGLGIGL